MTKLALLIATLASLAATPSPAWAKTFPAAPAVQDTF
jgi:hypothetical protein